MADTNKNPKVLEAAHAPNRLETLQALSSGLEKCQKSLNDYLDSKRNAFPRFFFISDDELLSILGSHEATCVQEHMIKVACVYFSYLLIIILFIVSKLICKKIFRTGETRNHDNAIFGHLLYHWALAVSLSIRSISELSFRIEQWYS